MTQYSGKVIRKTPVTPTQASASGVWKLNEQAAAIRNNNWPVAGVPDPISRSVRLRNSASAYFSKNYGTSPTNNKINTFSGWVKRGTIGTLGYIFAAYDGSSALAAGIWFQNDKLWAEYGGPSGSGRITTTAVYRDPSAWYHIVLAIDTTQATASNRVKLYVNGSQVTAFDTATNPTLNLATAFTFPNANNRIGANWDNSGPFDGYLTEINFIDGQALTPSSFGTTDPLTGAWIPMQYTGTYGTNGFYVDFRDNTSTTTLGLDYSGNSNNWTANNISLTAGSTYDSMLDVPTPWIGYSATTDTSAVTRGNYATVNRLAGAVFATYVSVTEGNLRATNLAAGAGVPAGGSIMVSSGKWYAEIQALVMGPNTSTMGITSNVNDTNALGNGGGTVSYGYVSNGNKRSSAGSSAYGATWGVNDIIGIALDMDAGTVTFYKNGVSQGVAFTGLAGNYTFAGDQFGSGSIVFNFGQRPFSYTPPTGFKTLCVTNLPTPTILNGASYMAASLYTGTGAAQSISNAVNGTSFQPDFVWTKSRSAVNDHILMDSVRGLSAALFSNLTNAEVTDSTRITSLNANGFTLGTSASVNQNSATFVAWQWKANGTPAVTNTNGSITSTVSANTTAGFSVVTYSGTSVNSTIGHGLGAAPRMIIVKSRSTGGTDWAVYHASLGATQVINLDLTAAATTIAGPWNNTAPTSSVFSVGTGSGSGDTNLSGRTYVAYCFAAVAGYSAFGSYTGNGSADGPFIYLGFRPRFILLKRTDTTGNWTMYDTARNPYNPGTYPLYPNLSNAEDPSTDHFDWLSSGFKMRSTNQNTNGGTFIYAAFAENPFKYSNAR